MSTMQETKQCYSKTMLVAPHIATGVTLGIVLGEPLLVVPAAIASHFLLDSVPHWQETMAPYHPTWKTYLRIPLDLGLGLAIILFALKLQPDHSLSILLGAFFAATPDLDVITVVFPRLKTKIVTKYWDWHCKIQREVSTLTGVVTQLAVIAISLITITMA
jgi:hypothetical protein